MQRARWYTAAAIAASLWTAAIQSGAQPAGAQKETARSLMIEGRAKMDARDYAGALGDFQAAHRIMNVPTTALHLARAQEALGLLMEARDTALSVARMPLQQDEPNAYSQARKSASELATSVAARIPSLVVQVSGLPKGLTRVVKLGDLPLAVELLGQPRELNPGKYVIEVQAVGYVTERREARIVEKQKQIIEISMVPAPEEVAPSTLAGAASPPTARESPTSSGPRPVASLEAGSRFEPRAGSRGGAPVWAWIAGGAGLIAAGVGTVFLVDWMNVRGRLAKDCPDNECDAAVYSADDVRAMRSQWNRDAALTVGLGAAAVIGISAGIVGLVMGPASSPPRGMRPSPWVADHGAGLLLEGQF